MFMQQEKIILFDGVCNLCSKSVGFVLKNEKLPEIKFASMQSDSGKQVLKTYNLPEDGLQSFVFIENGIVYTKSTAALRVSRYLKGGWSTFYVFMAIPGFIRDALYDLIAANRYRWFGKNDVCILPTSNNQKRFL